MTDSNYNLLRAVSSAFSVTTTDMQISPEDLTGLLATAQKHSILPLVCEGIVRTRSFEIAPEVKEKVFRCVLADQMQMSALQEIKTAFDKNRIEYMFLKGSSIKSLYPKSEMRLMGDIDVLIKEDRYGDICPIMENLGFSAVDETNHELVWSNSMGVVIELHKKLIPSYNDDYYTYFSDCWSMAEKVGDTTRYEMKPEIEYVYLVTHLAKHYRDGGIGLRHVIDLWRFAEEKTGLDFSKIENELDKIGLRVFGENLIRLIDVWFNGKKANDITDKMTERIIESGNFGAKEICDTAFATRFANEINSVSGAKFKRALQLCFPGFSKMKKRYPFLSKLPFLMPFMWIVRWFDAIFNRRKNIAGHYDRLTKINNDEVAAYEKELASVGLKFDLNKQE